MYQRKAWTPEKSKRLSVNSLNLKCQFESSVECKKMVKKGSCLEIFIKLKSQHEKEIAELVLAHQEELKIRDDRIAELEKVR